MVDNDLHGHHHPLARRLPLVRHFCGVENVSVVPSFNKLRGLSLSYRIPLGVLAFAVSFSGPLSNKISPKYVLLFGQGLLVVATCLLATDDSPSKYYSHALPAFILGSAGAMFSYTHTK